MLWLTKASPLREITGEEKSGKGGESDCVVFVVKCNYFELQIAVLCHFVVLMVLVRGSLLLLITLCRGEDKQVMGVCA